MARFDASADKARSMEEVKDAFIEYCMKALSSKFTLQEIAKNPLVPYGFMDAYVVARCLPVLAQNREQREEDWEEEEELDDALYISTRRAEIFINEWEPSSVMEAVLMLDLANFNAESDGSYDCFSIVPTSVESFLLKNMTSPEFEYSALPPVEQLFPKTPPRVHRLSVPTPPVEKAESQTSNVESRSGQPQ